MKLPQNIVPPPRKGTRRPTGAGPHMQGVRGQRARSGARRAAIAEQGR